MIATTPGRPAARGRMRFGTARTLTGVAVAVACLAALTGCTSAPADPRLDWAPDSACASPSAVESATGLASLRFDVDARRTETLKSTGCSYVDAADGIRLDAMIVPGPPDDVEFGSAAGIVNTVKASLGSGAHVGVSPTYCSVAVPKTGSGTIQVEIIGSSADRTQEAHACSHVVSTLDRFARQG